MEGELTSVKVSQDSRYALINRALDALGMHAVSVGPARCECADISHAAVPAGDTLVGDRLRADGAQVHGPQAVEARNTQRLWGRGRELCRDRQRR